MKARRDNRGSETPSQISQINRGFHRSDTSSRFLNTRLVHAQMLQRLRSWTEIKAAGQSDA